MAKDAEALLKARDEDEDFQSKKEILKEAGAVYRDGAKMCRLKIRYCVQALGDKGAV